MNRKLFALFLVIFLISTLIPIASAQEEQRTTIYFFWNYSCPHCTEEQGFLDKMEEKYPTLEIERYNVSENQQLWEEFNERYDSVAIGWPRTFVGEKNVFVGFTYNKGELEYNLAYKAYIGYACRIENAIRAELGLEGDACAEDVEEGAPLWIFGLVAIYLLSYFPLRKRISKRLWTAGLIAATIICFFALAILTPETVIKNFAKTFPFPVFVFIIALFDGFNPCAITVLIILLSLLTYTRSKKKMLLIGTAFIFTSAIMYFIFIMALILLGSWFFSAFGLMVLRVLGAGVFIAGAINIKDYFFFKKGVSLTISKKDELKIIKKARGIVQGVDKAESKKALLLALGGTIILAAFVNLVELGCSAILPVAYMGSLVQSFGESVGLVHVAYTAFYSLVYIIPLFAILFNFIYVFKSERLTEEQGRILKLIGGLVMLTLGAMLLIKPDLLIFG